MVAVDAREAPQTTHEIALPIEVEATWEPGRIAYRLLRELYTWFGFEESEIPYVAADHDGAQVISKEEILRDG
jgi:hypothetical protein